MLPPGRTITFRAWRAGHRYVPLAEVLVYLGPFVVDSAWQLEIEEWLGGGDLGAIPPEARLSTLDLLALIPPSVQVVDGVFTAWAGSARVVVVEAFDSTSWDITSTDERILTALADRYPDAHDLPT
ncbi:hypothetical protein [Amycolatopsis sp. 195334CR]|uniref:hypothetical protein n=1 Tax=Amycolatopsis sp. 195334CR TaxID=2814588 RepID=UPI001A8FEF6E|nr:hypothetical protein [Amycolatopsis sp. 195334CR]MBN6035870.1 hypothetical protein [Amycolatopsis sp. 195334CR]